MKRPVASGSMRRAFTLIELLCTIAIIAILAALLLPVLDRGLSKARRTVCVNNLRSVGTAFNGWAHEHSDLFPMQVSTNQGGTKEFADQTVLNTDLAFTHRHFQALSNELVLAKVLRCPSDNRRTPAQDFARLDNTNVSYWVNLAASFNRPASPLAGDRNVRTSGRTEWTFVTIGDRVEFNSELHGFKGNVLFSDAHVELLDAAGLLSAFSGTNGNDATLALPRPDFVPPDSSGPGSLEAMPQTANGESGTGTAKSEPLRPPASAIAKKSNDPGSTVNEAGPVGPTATGRDVPERASRGERNEGLMTLVMLDGTSVVTNWPAGKAVLGNTNWNRVEVPVPATNPIMEFIQDLTRLAARHTYLLLLLLLLIVAAMEASRRWAARKKRRRFR